MTIYIFEHVNDQYNYYRTERRSERGAWNDLKENHAHPNLNLVKCKECSIEYDNQEHQKCPKCDHDKSTKVNWKRDWILRVTIRSWRSPKECIDQKQGPVGCHKRFWNGHTESYLCYHDVGIPYSCLNPVYKLVDNKKSLVKRFLSESDAYDFMDEHGLDESSYSIVMYGGESK